MDEQAREEFFRVKKVVEKKKIKLQKEKAGSDHRKSGKPGEFTNPTSETCPCVVKFADMIEQFS